MTDLETTKAMLTKAEIVFSEEVPEHGPKHDEAVRLVIVEGDGEHNLGYREFVSQLGFDADGSFALDGSMGAWE